MATSLSLAKDFSSFSGTDIKVLINGEPIGTIQALSYAVQREKGPVYVMGRVDPLSFSRGKRGIAGTMITLMLDRHPLYRTPFSLMRAVIDKDEIYASPADLNNAEPPLDDLNALADSPPIPAQDLSANFQVTAPLFYFDQLPPMDFVVVGVNEYGSAATMRIYGAEFLNEGSGYSVDDMVIENQMTYIARTILPWQKMGEWDIDPLAPTTAFQPEPMPPIPQPV
jgi:hypothetical protein